MAATADYLAFDLGASSGRAVLGRFDGRRLALEEIHRFPNGPVRILDHLHWDAPRLLYELYAGLGHCAAHTRTLDGLGVDTWGVDFGLLSSDGDLLGLPYHYRDARTRGMFEQAFRRVPRAELYARTGIQFLEFNTLFQLLSMRLANRRALEAADQLLFMPDLLNYWITGVRQSEYSIASTSQMLAADGGWARDVLERLDLPTRLLPPLVPSGTALGPLRGTLRDEAGLSEVAVVAPACHDTAAAVAAVPLAGDDAAYISLGTWALVGAELAAPICTPAARESNFTNEGGVADTIRFLKNTSGLWLLQECRRVWEAQGMPHSYEELAALASAAPAFGPFVDPDDPRFLEPGDMPAQIRRTCADTGQDPPDSIGVLVRCVLESLALKCHANIERLAALIGRPVNVIHIVGGGARNTLLCRLIAAAAGRPVIAGPVEATAAGNVMVQALARGRVRGLDEIRHVIAYSSELTRYEPDESEAWPEARARYAGVLAGAGGATR